MVHKVSHRVERIADIIQRELARLVRLEVKDPRLNQLITIAAVKVSRDLANAKVYITVLDPEGDIANISQVIDALNHAAGFLRTQLAQHLSLRTVPQLLFVYDKSLQQGNQMSSLIQSAMSRTSHSQQDPDES